MSSPIPSIAHFIWDGDDLPWVHALAIRSALERGGFDRVVLHHAQPLQRTPFWSELAHSAFEAVPIDPADLFGPFGELGRRLSALHARLDRPAARANVLRAGLLARYGGVYLDMDTVTLQSLAPLRGARPFCGEETIAFPATAMRLGNPAGLARGVGLHLLRAGCKHLPAGVRWFRRLSRFYPRGVNNAVLAAPPADPLMLSLLEHLVALSPARQRARFALGTHALQALAGTPAGARLVVHPPAVFYPLGPELSHHWFKLRAQVSLQETITRETRVVHWYASVENRRLYRRIDPAYVRAHAGRQLFSALAARFVD